MMQFMARQGDAIPPEVCRKLILPFLATSLNDRAGDAPRPFLRANSHPSRLPRLRRPPRRRRQSLPHRPGKGRVFHHSAPRKRARVNHHTPMPSCHHGFHSSSPTRQHSTNSNLRLHRPQPKTNNPPPPLHISTHRPSLKTNKNPGLTEKAEKFSRKANKANIPRSLSPWASSTKPHERLVARCGALETPSL